MSDSARIYAVLDRIEENQNRNHTEVVQRLTKLETNQHDPHACPGAKRIEDELQDHLHAHAAEKTAEGWKSFVKDTVKLVLAAVAGVFSTKL